MGFKSLRAYRLFASFVFVAFVAVSSVLINAVTPCTTYALTLDEFDVNALVISSNVGQVDSAVVAANVIGGTRHIETTLIGGSDECNLSSGASRLSHAHGFSSACRGRIVWDGDFDDSAVNSTGLGGINLLQDIPAPTSSDGIIVTIRGLEAGPVTIRLTLYTNDNKKSQLEKVFTDNINYPVITGNVDALYAFDDFTSISGQPVDFTDIGAIELEIFGSSSATDLTLLSLTTTGCNAAVPTATSDSYDKCGVLCGNDDTCCLDKNDVNVGVPGGSCDSGNPGICGPGTLEGPMPGCACKSNENGSNEICDGKDNDCDGDVDETFTLLGDSCSIGQDVCSVNGTYECNAQGGIRCSAEDNRDDVDDCENSRGCDGVPNSGLVDDACGVCGGDGMSCADCLGVPNGTAEIDRCGVCDGDGTSCLDCKDNDIQDAQFSLDATTKDQEKLVRLVRKRIKRVTRSSAFTARERRDARKSAKSMLQEALRIGNENWHITWTELESQFKTCTNSFCTSISNASSISSFQANNASLHDIGVTIADMLRKLSITAKSRRNRKRARRAKRKSSEYFAENEAIATSIPTIASDCTQN